MNLRNGATIATLALAIAGLALPATGAATRPAGRTNDTSDVISRYLSNRTTDASDVVSRYVANVLRSSPATSAQTTLASSNGFDWSVALIGAGGALAIVLLLSAAGMGIARHRHSHLKSA